MKSKIRKLVCLACMLAMAMVAYAEGNESGWTVSPFDYQYDMTVYAQLKIDDAVVSDYSNYEVAAFVGDECRGVAEIQTKENSTWLYIRVRSASASGEKISFKLFDKTEGKIKRIAETVDFESQGLEGMPSSPFDLTSAKYTPGDVNDDGSINIADVTSILSIMAGNQSDSLIREAADVNDDGAINVADVTSVLSIMAGNK
ncbi:MAG: dockerin type I repeat-containing protein [Prevotella sp.]|nr:dockerin type I repeat-containing protein [Prevotella sp.]